MMTGEVVKHWTQDNMQDWHYCTGQSYDDRWSGQTLNTGQHARLKSVQGRTMMTGEVAKHWTQGNMQDWHYCTGQSYDDRWSGQTLNTGQHARLTSVQSRAMMIGEVAKHWTQGNMQDWQVYRAELWWQVKWSNTEHRTTCKTDKCTGQSYDDRWSGQTLNTGQHARLTSVQGRTMMIGEVVKHWTQGTM